MLHAPSGSRPREWLSIFQFGMCLQALRSKDCHGRLPLHLVCLQRMSPALRTVETLVQGWPEAGLVKDEIAFLPLHHACHNKRVEDFGKNLMVLVQASPETIGDNDTMRQFTIAFRMLQPDCVPECDHISGENVSRGVTLPRFKRTTSLAPCLHTNSGN